MMGLETLRRVNAKATLEAQSEDKQPYVATKDGDDGVFKSPHFGDYIPKGWEEEDLLFVDSSGFGIESEPALTTDQFLSKVKKGYGYSVRDAGQFQVYIQVFKKIDEV